jgi:hypothetical protein
MVPLEECENIIVELIKEGRRCLWKNIYQLMVPVWEKEVT